jgi:hypothetical protein
MAVSPHQEADTQDLLGKSDEKNALIDSKVASLKYSTL